MDDFEKPQDFDVVCLWGFSEEEAGTFSGKIVIFFAPECKNHSFHAVYYDGINCDVEAFQALCETLVFLRFCYLISPGLAKEDKALAEMYLKHCMAIEWQVQLAASDYCDFGLTVFKNVRRSLKTACDTESFFAMKDAFSGIPAFICGAGPSAEKEFMHLQDMENRGVIFAGGAALGKLAYVGAPLHIAAGIDPNPCYDRVLMQHAFEAPFFYQSRFSTSLLDTIQGAPFLVPSNPGYPLCRWMEEGRSFDAGWTVSTFCAALAVHFGCNPIVFVGVDLSYEEENEKATTWDDVVQGQIKTQKDWVLASKWLEALALENKMIDFYTTSECGLSMNGIRKIVLEQAKDTILQDCYDIEGIVHSIRALQSLNTNLNKAHELEKSLALSLSYADELLRLFEKHYPKDPKDKGEFVLNAVELEQEIAYKNILQPLWNIWQYPLHREIEDPYAREVNRLLFFKKILQEYKACLCR